MSAICGVILRDLQPAAAQRCRIIQAALAPYGRAAEGLWDGQHVALANRLAHLLPEDVHDRQPLHSACGRFVLVADVRLDNRAALAKELGLPASTARTLADSDVLLAAYSRWKTDTPAHLIGDFAFAAWDRHAGSLFLARDQMGRRPLFYHQGKHWFGFSSMPAGLLALPDVPSVPDQERLLDMLCALPDRSDSSFFEGIHRLLPGHSATLHADGTLHARCYWVPPIEERVFFKSDDDYVDAFLEILEEAVRCRLRSTGSIASQISAGFDSSAVTSIAARQLGIDDRGLHAFTAVPHPEGLPSPSGEHLDEGPLAAQVAALFPNVHHHLVRADDPGMTGMMALMFRLYGRPARNVVNAVWDMSICRLASANGASTLLTGEMGNFTISYDGTHALNTLLREGRLLELRRQLARQAAGVRPRARARILYEMLMPSMPEGWKSAFERIAQRARAQADPRVGINPEAPGSATFLRQRHPPGARPATRRLWEESRRWRQQLLLKHDFAEYGKGTLALAGVDRRDPTVDIRLIRYCQAIPVEQFNKDGVDRWLLRRALLRYWPARIVASRIKGQQGADWRYRIARNLDALTAEVTLLETEPLARHLLDLGALQRQLARSGASDRAQNLELLRFIAAGHFLRLASKKGEF